jgi:uncharacterized membrane protein
MLQPLPLSKARIEALTDGIFAVTMTLLVLDLKFEDRVSGDPDRVVHDLLALLPYIDDYVISFVVLCVFWLAHLRLIRRVREVDATFAWLNLVFLLFTTFLPPLTSWIGHRSEQPPAAIVYGANLILILGCETLMWRHACRYLVNETVTDADALWRSVRHRFFGAAAIIVAGILAALIEIQYATNVGYASYVYLLLIGAGFVRTRIDTSRTQHES